MIASRYKVVREIGRGGMGVVYEVEHLHTAERHALKVLIGNSCRDPQALVRFKREARVSASVRSAHVVRVTDADTAAELDGAPFLVMDLLQGEDLEVHLRAHGSLAPKEVVAILQQVSQGLGRAHALGIVHRDLKPENLFLQQAEGDTPSTPPPSTPPRAPVVKILDFGISKLTRPESSADDDLALRVTATGAVIGTPLYMAPEQAGGGSGAGIGPWTDVWAIGLIVMRMLTGESYWGRDVTMTTLMRRLLGLETLELPSRRWPSHPWMSPALDAWFAKSCALEATERFTSVEEQVASLADAFQGSTIASADTLAVRPSDSTPPVTPTLQSARRASLVTAVMAVVLFGGACLVLVGFAMSKSERSKEHAAVTSRALVSSATPTAVMDQPLPKSNLPLAVSAYKAGLQELHDGDSKRAATEFRRAADLDPTMAAAFLRLALVGDGSSSADDSAHAGREAYLRAVSLRRDLSDRDRGLLDAIEPLVRDEPDPSENIARMRRVIERYPLDAELHGLMAGFLVTAADPPSVGLAEAQRAVELDPTYASAWQELSIFLLMARDDTAGAVDALERCVELAPASRDCLTERAHLKNFAGDCAAMEADARRARIGLRASAMFATGSSRESIEDVLRSPLYASEETPNEELLISLDILAGRFDVADAVLKRRAQSIVGPTKSAPVRIALTRALLLLETGSPGEADGVVAAVLRHKDSYAGGPPNEEHLLYGIRRITGGMTAREWRSEIDRSLKHPYFQTEGFPGGGVWAVTFGAGVTDGASAVAALEELPRFGMGGKFGYVRGVSERVDALAGHVFLLAGRFEEAIAHLKAATRRCMVLEYPFEHTQAHLWLGQALEQTKDRDGACAAYGVVLSRWGSAKPRSISAEQARARARALGCN